MEELVKHLSRCQHMGWMNVIGELMIDSWITTKLYHREMIVETDFSIFSPARTQQTNLIS